MHLFTFSPLSRDFRNDLRCNSLLSVLHGSIAHRALIHSIKTFNPIWIGILDTPIWIGGGSILTPPLLSAKMLRFGWNFPNLCKTKIPQKTKIFVFLKTSILWPLDLKTPIWRQKSISVKMLQMGWNFDTSSKIRQKTQKST